MKQQPCPKRPHILVVEDEPLIRMSTVASFEDLGCTALEASSADEAVGLLAENPSIEVLFTDIQMPGDLDGLEFAHRVRRQFPDIKIVLSSGRILPPKAALPQGARFLAKPYYYIDILSIAQDAGC